MRFAVWGLTGTLEVEDASSGPQAERVLWRWLTALDAACNRFDPRSEICRLNACPDADVRVSPVLEQAVAVALAAATATADACDPTIEPALVALGYDTDFDVVTSRTPREAGPAVPAAGPAAVTLDRERHTVRLAPGCRLDLGATAKALACDVVADELAPRGGALVEIGGDVAVRGRGPTGPWVVGVDDGVTTPDVAPRVFAHGGGIATSSTARRSWRLAAGRAHHIIDPRTGAAVAGPYASATVAAPTCWQANAFSTAALVWGAEAPARLAGAGWAARLVRAEGRVERVAGWPAEASA
ncbi:MAG: FAD:protein FMN transferase [Acidimicrobiales bacterium]